MVRYHSAYPWHTGGAYQALTNDRDRTFLPWILEFNKYDLYTKDDSGMRALDRSVEELWAYYMPIINKYFPTEELRW